MFYVLPIPVGFLILILLMSIADAAYNDRRLGTQILAFILFMAVLLISLIFAL